LVSTFIGGGETILRAFCSSALWQICISALGRRNAGLHPLRMQEWYCPPWGMGCSLFGLRSPDPTGSRLLLNTLSVTVFFFSFGKHQGQVNCTSPKFFKFIPSSPWNNLRASQISGLLYCSTLCTAVTGSGSSPIYLPYCNGVVFTWGEGEWETKQIYTKTI
jgi:hypothetical protein